MLAGDQRPKRLRGGARRFLGAGLYIGILQIGSLFHDYILRGTQKEISRNPSVVNFEHGRNRSTYSSYYRQKKKVDRPARCVPRMYAITHPCTVETPPEKTEKNRKKETFSARHAACGFAKDKLFLYRELCHRLSGKRPRGGTKGPTDLADECSAIPIFSSLKELARSSSSLRSFRCFLYIRQKTMLP